MTRRQRVFGRKTIRTVLTLALAFVATACVQGPVPTVSIPPSARTIAVVSAIAPELRLGTTGLIVFQDALDIVDVTDWHLEDVAFEAAKAVLSPQYSVLRERVEAHDLQEVTAALAAAPNRVKADLYLVITNGPGAQPYRQIPNVLRGIGVSKQELPFVTRPPIAHTYLVMSLLDGPTMKPLATTSIRKFRETKFPLSQRADEPAEPLDGLAWQTAWHELSDAAQDLIRSHITGLLSESVMDTIRMMQLVPRQKD